MFSQDNFVSQDTACFSCSGAEFSGYLKSGYFQNFLYSELKITSGTTVKLFGKLFPVKSCMWVNMQHLFKEIKQNFITLKNNALKKTDFFSKDIDFTATETIRIDILKIFNIFLSNLQELNISKHKQSFENHSIALESNHIKYYLMHLSKEVKNLLLFVGRISSISGIQNIRDFECDTSKNASNFYHYYHLCLDIWYNCLAVMYVIHSLMPTSFDEIFCDFIDQPGLFLQATSFAVYELSTLAMNRYKNAQLYNSVPYTCPCIKEFWIMLINLLDEFNLRFEGPSFWSLYLQIIMKSTANGHMKESLSIDTFCTGNAHFPTQDFTEAWFWLTSHVASLYKYNTLGYLCEDKIAKSGNAVGKFLVNNIISKFPDLGEKCIRNTLSFCIHLVKLWEPSGDILLPLTDFYIKRIEEKFSVQGTQLLYLFKDALTWFNYIQNISNYVSYSKESSFDCFLCILNIQLKMDFDNTIWRSLKGRIYSKFIPKKIKEMSEVGLQNTFSLLLIIAVSGQFEVLNKICEIASIIETVANPNKQNISWKAMFVLMYICQDKKHNLSKITSVISKFFNSISADYSRINKDSIHKAKLMDLLSVYLVNMNELFKRNSSLNLSEYQLISAGFSDLLTSRGVTEVNYILGIILTILQRIQKVTESSKIDCITNETEYIRTLQSVFNYIYPVTENIASMDTAPLVISDIAATLTKLTYDFSSSINCVSHDYLSIFRYFVCKENVSSVITCQYLCFVFKFSDLMTELNVKLADLDILIFQAWLKCIINLQTKTDWMYDLTRRVLQQTEVLKILPNIENFNLQTDDHLSSIINFFCFLGDTFNKSHLQQKTKIAQKVQRYFKNYVSCLLSKIKKEKDGPSLTHVYKLTSHLVEYCSAVLHFHVTSDHILLQILDQTIYPQILFSRDKSLQSLVSCSVKEFLPHFIKGLLKLDYRKDKSIEREIRDIYIYYLSVFPASKNPLTKLIIDIYSQKHEGLTADACSFILEVLKSGLLSGNIEKPLSVFEFYQEVFRLSPLPCKQEITNILLRTAMEIYMKQNNSLTEFLKVLVRKTLVYFKEKVPFVHTKRILIPVVEWFIQEKLQWSVVRGFSVLDLFVEYLPLVVSDIVPFLTKSVETLERNRGLGEDMLLRNGLRTVVNKLQAKLA